MRRRLLVGLAAFAAAGPACADWAINMPKGVSEMSIETWRLHMQVFWWCVAIGVVVFGAMAYALVKHRKSRGQQAASFSHNSRLEVVWTVIPVVILLIMAVPAAETLVKLEYSGDPDLTVVVTGYQWRWHYAFPEEGVAYFSSIAAESNIARRKGSGIDPATVENYLLDVDNPLVVPVGAKVRILLTSKDVIHSWWVPALAIKKDAIPGFMNETWFLAEATGTYRGQCAELCGVDHAYMPVVVEVVEPDEFRSWLARMQEVAEPEPVAATGEKQ